VGILVQYKCSRSRLEMGKADTEISKYKWEEESGVGGGGGDGLL